MRVRGAFETMLNTELQQAVTDPVNEKDRRERLQALETEPIRWTNVRRTGWCPFRSKTKSGRVRRRAPVNEARKAVQ